LRIEEDGRGPLESWEVAVQYDPQVVAVTAVEPFYQRLARLTVKNYEGLIALRWENETGAEMRQAVKIFYRIVGKKGEQSLLLLTSGRKDWPVTPKIRIEGKEFTPRLARGCLVVWSEAALDGRFWSEDISIPAAESDWVTIYADSREPIWWWMCSLRFDQTKLRVSSVRTTEAYDDLSTRFLRFVELEGGRGVKILWSSHSLREPLCGLLGVPLVQVKFSALGEAGERVTVETEEVEDPDCQSFSCYFWTRLNGHSNWRYEREPFTVEIVPYAGIGVFTGDANCDGSLDIGDGVTVLNYLFGGGDGQPCCLAAYNVNTDHEVDISDAISILSYLFAGGLLHGPDGTVFGGDQEPPGCRSYNKELVPLPCENPCSTEGKQ